VSRDSAVTEATNQKENAMNTTHTMRIVAAIASVLITTVLLSSVVIGITGTAQASVSMADRSASAPRG